MSWKIIESHRGEPTYTIAVSKRKQDAYSVLKALTEHYGPSGYLYAVEEE